MRETQKSLNAEMLGMDGRKELLGERVLGEEGLRRIRNAQGEGHSGQRVGAAPATGGRLEWDSEVTLTG